MRVWREGDVHQVTVTVRVGDEKDEKVERTASATVAVGST